MSLPRYQLLSRPQCHLCHEMEALLSSELPRLGESYVVVNVDSNSDWRRRFGEVIPVLLREGVPVAKIRLNRRQLERIVSRSRRHPIDNG